MSTLVKRRIGPAPVGFVLLPLLLLGCLAYYFAFATHPANYDPDTGWFQGALNAHDHYVYVFSIDRIRDGDAGYELSNDIGIAAIYVVVAKLFPFLLDPDYALISLAFNCAVLVGCYALYADICRRLALGTVGRLSFFANSYFIYFAQLINKDMLTMFAFLLAVQCGMRRRLWPLVALLPVQALVRQQLVVFTLAYVLFMAAPRPGGRIAWVYVFTSLGAGFLSIFASVIGEESLGEGFSSWLIAFNQDWYVGYLLFNPLRLVQYVVDAYASFSFGTPTGGIDAAKVLRLPQLLALLLVARPLASMATRFTHWLQTPVRPLVLVTVAYLIAWLMNPTINARYVMLITPVLMLFALYARRHPLGGRQ